MNAAEIEYEEGSRNVFEDIGFEGAVAEQLSHTADLVAVLFRYQEELSLSQAAFSRLAGIPQPRLSKLYNGKIAGMSTDKLIDAIRRLGGHVVIRVEQRPASKVAGRVDLELA
jgi:predicted XRE-type DNA-binding protein